MSGLIFEWRSRRGKLVKNEQGAWVLPKETPWKCYASMKGRIIYEGDIPLSQCKEETQNKTKQEAENEPFIYTEDEDVNMMYYDDDEYYEEEEYEVVKG